MACKNGDILPSRVIALANLVFGALYMYSLGVFNEGGGSYTASMRYLWPTLSLLVAVVLIQDYILDHRCLGSLWSATNCFPFTNSYGYPLVLAVLDRGDLWQLCTWYLTIRGRGESARLNLYMLAVFGMLTLLMLVGLFIAHSSVIYRPLPCRDDRTGYSIAGAVSFADWHR